MLLWLVFAVMTAVVVGLLLHPLLVRREGAATTISPDGSGAVYRDQLAEVEVEAARGLIGAEEAEAARREIARRLIASATPSPEVPDSPAVASQGTPWVAAAIAALLPLVALVTYIQTGAPGLPAQPVAARRATPPVNAELAKLIGAVEARLKANPDDGRGWDVIAPVYLRLQRYAEAADAYAHATRLLGESARRLGGLAEARMLAEGGRIGPEARAALKRLLELEPGHIQARFWLAFAREQDGDLAAAATEYEKLLAEAPKDVSWRPMLEERLQVVRGETGAGGSTATAPADPRSAVPGPSASDIAAAERMSPSDRQAMIDGMVGGLAARLEKDGRDLPGWERLIRAYTVLGRKDEAVAALGRARKSLADEPQALAALADLARSLGLGT